MAQNPASDLNNPAPVGKGGALEALQTSAGVRPGDALGVRREAISIGVVKNTAHIVYWTAPYVCRIRAIGFISSVNLSGAGPTLTVAADNGSTHLLEDTAANHAVIFGNGQDIAPAADILTVLTTTAAGGGAKLQNNENIAPDAVIKITATASNDGAFPAAAGASSVQIVVFYEPALSVTDASQDLRVYTASQRGKDS